METVNPGRDRVICITVICGVLATVAILLRFVARWRSKASFAADDWWIATTLIPSYGVLVVGLIMITSGGGGRHSNTLTESQMATFLKTLNAAVITYTLTIAMVKISILSLYRRLFETVSIKRAILTVAIACVSWLIAALLCLAFQCHTEAERYNANSLFEDQCINLKAYWTAIAGSNLGLDLVILCMPIHVVWNLELATRQKIAVSGIFALGAFVCVAGLMRIITIDLVEGADLSYNIIESYMWSQIEPTMAIVCACLTTLQPLFAGIDPNFQSSLTRTSRSTASSSMKSRERWSDLSGDPESDWEKEERRLRSLSERLKNGIEVMGFDEVLYARTLEGIGIAEMRAEGSRRWNSWHDDDISTTVRAEGEGSFV